ncbi:hypothetical protein WAI453_005300 [Rhynchosporium graminicola]
MGVLRHHHSFLPGCAIDLWEFSSIVAYSSVFCDCVNHAGHFQLTGLFSRPHASIAPASYHTDHSAPT